MACSIYVMDKDVKQNYEQGGAAKQGYFLTPWQQQCGPGPDVPDRQVMQWKNPGGKQQAVQVQGRRSKVRPHGGHRSRQQEAQVILVHGPKEADGTGVPNGSGPGGRRSRSRGMDAQASNC